MHVVRRTCTIRTMCVRMFPPDTSVHFIKSRAAAMLCQIKGQICVSIAGTAQMCNKCSLTEVSRQQNPHISILANRLDGWKLFTEVCQASFLGQLQNAMREIHFWEWYLFYCTLFFCIELFYLKQTTLCLLIFRALAGYYTAKLTANIFSSTICQNPKEIQ